MFEATVVPALGSLLRITTAGLFISNYPAHTDNLVGFLRFAFAIKADHFIAATSLLVFASM
jgi:hypothetical protein